jgi:hypothetical protein
MKSTQVQRIWGEFPSLTIPDSTDSCATVSMVSYHSHVGKSDLNKTNVDRSLKAQMIWFSYAITIPVI